MLHAHTPGHRVLRAARSGAVPNGAVLDTELADMSFGQAALEAAHLLLLCVVLPAEPSGNGIALAARHLTCAVGAVPRAKRTRHRLCGATIKGAIATTSTAAGAGVLGAIL